ncbi:Chloride channel protein 1 [Symbiodinium microadriaticum]|uniref:Chloride channel protein 1 n=1 Tax=Symbiodinium microadriaticum TaxID=2951 RepID=A0A1Q9C3K7_SYMMI|nr:Chloride channel protein 1 [Symbiodinium microadriaticum]
MSIAGATGSWRRAGVCLSEERGPLRETTLNLERFLTEIFRREAHLHHPELAKASGLLFLAVAKTSYTIMALSMPVPAGVVAPSLMLGGIFGRCVAAAIPPSMQEFLAPDGDFGQYIARFAIVGATCFCGAVCRVNSVVVTVFELIAVPRLILPLTLATIVSNVCANRIGPSIFDSILLMKKIPAMPTLRAIQKTLQPVRKVLDKSLLGCCLPRHAVAHDFSHLKFVRSGMETQGRNLPLYIPIVEEVEDSPSSDEGSDSDEVVVSFRKHKLFCCCTIFSLLRLQLEGPAPDQSEHFAEAGLPGEPSYQSTGAHDGRRGRLSGWHLATLRSAGAWRSRTAAVRGGAAKDC